MKNQLCSFLLILLCLLGFTGCPNFLTGSELKRELEELIEIANAKEISVEVNLKSTRSGTISPIGISKRKQKLPFEIELSIRNDYEFNGVFDLYEKSGGKTTPLKNPEKIIKFVEKSKYHASVGDWNYIYEVTILTDRYDSILINPHIVNLNSTEPPVILDVNIDYRYGNDKKIRDYFDVQLFVECDADPNSLVYASFYNLVYDNEYIDGEWLGCIYDADIVDIGNGKYHMTATVDLREVELYDGYYNLILYVENDGNVKGSFEVDDPFIKQSYSKTKVQVYNAEDTLYDNQNGRGYKSFIFNECARTEETLTTFSNDLKLIIFDIDEEGLGLTTEGKPVQLKYGFCQNQDEIESLELNNTISEYSVYEFEPEFRELLPKIEESYLELNEWAQLKNYLDENPDLEYTSAFDVADQMNRNPKTAHIFNVDLNTFDFDLRVVRDQAFFNERHKIYEILEKYQNQAIRNKSIVKLKLPKNLDKKKDIYIKISSENGIDNQKYVIFTIPAPPMVLGTEEDEENIKINLYKINDYIHNYIYSYNLDLKKWVCDEYRQSFSKEYANYGFYVSSFIQYEHRLEDYNPIGRDFNLHTLDIRKYKTDVSDAGLIKFPSEASIEIYADELGSKKHNVSITLDREIYNQFDGVFIKYGLNPNDIETIILQEDNVFSFNVDTKNFYTLDGKNRTDYIFSVYGVKNGVSYETVYTIDASDNRVEDNYPPTISVEGIYDFYVNDFIMTTVAVDSTGNFLTIMGIPTDIGDNLDDIVSVDIYIIQKDGSYRERLETEGDVTKYLNIPINHLVNGTYILELSVEDDIGNLGSIPPIFFKIDRESVLNKVKIIKTDVNKFTIDVEETDAQKYALSYFDKTESLWKSLETSGDVDTPAEYEKTGFFQLHLNNLSETCKYDNYFGYPYLFYFPEEKKVERDFQLWRNSIRITTDKPFFIHFLKSDTDWGKDVEAWEAHQSYSYSIGNNDIYEPFYNEMYGSYFTRTFEEIKNYSSSFAGNEINPCVVEGDYTATPYVCQIPWEKFDKEYAAAVIIWADNKKDLILLDK